MALSKIGDFYPNYKEELFDGEDIKGLDVYAGGSDEKIGDLHDILVDDSGRFRYFVIDTGFWIFGKKVLLPVGRTEIDDKARRIYAVGLTKDQVENLPEFHDQPLDYDYEDRVRSVYRPQTNVQPDAATASRTYNRDSYHYEHEPALYGMNQQAQQTFRLYEERLVANKQRRKAGEVAIGKRIETETARVAVPVENERVVIERLTPSDVGTPVSPSNADFRAGEVARMEIYEETPDIHKEAVVREEIRIRKQVERDTVEAQETLRREELDVDSINT
jgi:uncharacterized protein (TIGR02271 family)